MHKIYTNHTIFIYRRACRNHIISYDKEWYLYSNINEVFATVHITIACPGSIVCFVSKTRQTIIYFDLFHYFQIKIRLGKWTPSTYPIPMVYNTPRIMHPISRFYSICAEPGQLSFKIITTSCCIAAVSPCPSITQLNIYLCCMSHYEIWAHVLVCGIWLTIHYYAMQPHCRFVVMPEKIQFITNQFCIAGVWAFPSMTSNIYLCRMSDVGICLFYLVHISLHMLSYCAGLSVCRNVGRCFQFII